MSLSPTLKQTGVCGNFQIVIVSAVKICETNVCTLLQLLGDFVPRIPAGASPLDPVEASPESRWAAALLNENSRCCYSSRTRERREDVMPPAPAVSGRAMIKYLGEHLTITP